MADEGTSQRRYGPRDLEARLARSVLFSVFPQEKLKRMASSAPVMELEPGGLLCQRGDPGDGAYLILEGELEVRTLSAGGKTVRLAALGAGELAGEMAALDGAPRSADMVASRRTRLLKISRTTLLEALEAEPKAAVALIAALVGRLRIADAAIEAQRLLDLGGRLANLLLSEAGSGAGVAMTQTEMARRLGASREKVNRKLHAWADEGLVSMSRAGVKLLHKDRLEGLIRKVEAR